MALDPWSECPRVGTFGQGKRMGIGEGSFFSRWTEVDRGGNAPPRGCAANEGEFRCDVGSDLSTASLGWSTLHDWIFFSIFF